VKKTWSEALAGFANASGGVLIFGVDARKDPATNVDAANGELLIPQLDALRSRLQELHPQATDPPVAGVEIESFPDPNEVGPGFVVCYIPESGYKPHRAETSGKRWVIRIGDSFVDIPVAVLRSRYFPHRQSYVFLEVGRNVVQDPHVAVKALYRVRLYNEGPATADRVLLVIRQFQGMRVNTPNSWKAAPSADGWRVQLPDPLHPGAMLDGFDTEVAFTRNVGDVEFDVQLYAADQMPVIGVVARRGAAHS
jgi:hypothetical protein